jgi:hypothetical protein
MHFLAHRLQASLAALAGVLLLASAAPLTANAAEQLDTLAAEAFVWGYPVNYNLGSMAAALSGKLPILPKGEINRFSHSRQAMGVETDFVSPNIDVLFSVAVCDLKNGPLVLNVPDFGKRYYVVQFLDPWTNNFAYLGRRAGTPPGKYLIVDEHFTGEAPAGMQLIRSPQPLFAMIVRIALDDEHNVAPLNALQDGLTVQQLDPSKNTPLTLANTFPQGDPAVPEQLRFWENLRVNLAAFPPPAAEQEKLQRMAPLGLLDKQSPYVNADPQLTAALLKGMQAGMAEIEIVSKGTAQTVNGWSQALHNFDYNLDYFEIGVRNEAQWKTTREAAPLKRAAAARMGLWGNPGYEAAFFVVWVDGAGQQLNGAHRYEWTLPANPPAKAFWSMTMYNVPKFYLVPNPIKRYGISSITPGLKYNADGSVTMYIQKDNPGPDKQSNWLPAPEGDFRPMLSLYEPGDAALDPAFSLPPIRRVD